MCDKLVPIKVKRVEGYKVVMEKDGKQYSAAMGIEYRSGRLLRVPKKQDRLTDNFNDSILDSNAGFGFKQDMVGRTAAFKLRVDAGCLAGAIANSETEEGYVTSVYLVRLSNGLMEGRYGSEEPVYAGRRMTFISKESF